MKACKVPCINCPFRKDSMKGFLGGYTPVELHQLVMNEQPFPCHMGLPKDSETLSPEVAAQYPLCAGAIIYMRKNGKSPRKRSLALLVSKVTPYDIENILNTSEFLEHHKPIT